MPLSRQKLRVDHKAIRFMVVFLALVGIVLACHAYRSRSNLEFVAFEGLKPDERVIYFGNAVSLQGSHKLHHLRHGKQYGIGVFGDHTVGQFSRGDLPEPYGKQMFNYFLQAASLPEIADVIRYAAEHELLPKDVLIIQIENPYVAGGQPLIAHDRSDLGQFAFFNWGDASLSEKFLLAMRWCERAVNRVKEVLSLQNIWSNIFAPIYGAVVVEPDTCKATNPDRFAAPPWVTKLPSFIEMFVIGFQVRTPGDKKVFA